MSSLSFETGIKTFEINGDPNRVISFCPTDFNFANRVYDGFMGLETTQRKYSEMDIKTPEDALEATRRADKDIRDAINAMFESDVADIIFGNVSTYALSGGIPIWANFMVAVLEECGELFKAQGKMNPKLESMLKKYKK